jgi:aconitate hydratase 2/2-methylisocitrate dehydratase
MGVINADSDQVYRYLNFDQIDTYANVAKAVTT